MSPLALIPGFATDTHFSIFRDAWGPDGGFRAFRASVERGEASVFRWGLRTHAGFLQSVNPWFARRLYLEERQRTERPQVQQRLLAWLARERPRTIVCHSLGCRLLAKTVQTHGAPASVQRVIFNQADLSVTEFADVVQRAPDITFVNTYCVWDPSLLLSSCMGGEWRVGLCAVPIASVQNRFFPLWRLLNLHMSAIRDRVFRQRFIGS